MELYKIGIEGIDNIYAVSKLAKEFSNAVNEVWKKNPPYKRYQKRLIENLAVLSNELENAQKLPQFEKLIGTKNLYAIRYPNSKKNVRVIYTIEDEFVILLYAFLEKNDSDYKRAIEISKQRLKELE